MAKWNSARVTKEQKEASTNLLAQWRGDMGQQPWAVFSKEGKKLAADRGAVCLSGLWHTAIPSKDIEDAILFQYPVLGIDAKRNDLVNSNSDIIRWMSWMCASPTVRPWLALHTKGERLTMGIPITLNCPKNIPLLVSTYLRWPWDRHNNKRSPFPFYIKDRFEVSWEEAFFIGACLTAIPGTGATFFGVRSYSDCHSPFGDDITLYWARRYASGNVVPEDFAHIGKFQPNSNRNPGIESFYGTHKDEDGGETRFNTWVSDSVVDEFKAVKQNWGESKIAIKEFDNVVTYLLTMLRGER